MMFLCFFFIWFLFMIMFVFLAWKNKQQHKQKKLIKK
jgi:preprotein translocase subunit YajC